MKRKLFKLSIVFQSLVLLVLLQQARGQDQIAFNPVLADITKTTSYKFIINIPEAINAQSLITLTFPDFFGVTTGTPTTCSLTNPVTAGVTAITGCSCSAATFVCTITTPIQIPVSSSYILTVGTITNPPYVPDPQKYPISFKIQFSDGTGVLTSTTSTFSVGYVFNAGLMETPVPTITQGTTQVNTKTTYDIKFYPLNNILADGFVRLFMPQSCTFGSDITVSVLVDSTYFESPSFEKNIDFNTLDISGLFPSGFTASSTKSITVTVKNIYNPVYVGNSEYIRILTTNKDKNLTDYSNSTLRVTTSQAGTLTAVLFEQDPPSSKVVSTATSLFFKILPQFTFPNQGKDGAVKITFPTNFDYSTTISCNFILGGAANATTTPSCSRSGNVIQTVDFIYASSSEIWVIISGLINPKTTEPGSFKFQTVDAVGREMCSGTPSWTYQATPATLTVNSVVRSVTNIGASTTVTLNITTASALNQYGVIEVNFPADQLGVSASPTCFSITGTSAETARTCYLASNTTFSTIQFLELCSASSAGCAAGTNLILKITSNANNPSGIAVPLTSSVVIYTKTGFGGGQYSIDGSPTGVQITPALDPTQLTDIVVTKTGSNVVGKDANLQYSFTPNSYIRSNGGSARFYFPTMAFYPSITGTVTCSLGSTTKTCSITTVASQTYIQYVQVNNICNPTSECSTTPITIKINTIRNSLNTFPIPTSNNNNAFIVETLNNLGQRVDYTTWNTLPDLTLVASTLSSVSTSLTTPIVGGISSTVLSFIPSTEVPASTDYNSRIIIQVPAEATLDPTASASCSASVQTTSSGALALQCTYSATSSPQTLTITHTLSDSTLLRGNTVSVTMTGLLRLPNSGKPSSPFTITSISTINSADYTIDTVSQGTLTAAIPATLTTYQALRSSGQASASVSVDFQFVPLHPIPENGYITLELPSDQFVQVGGIPENMGVTYNSANLACTIDSSNSSHVKMTFQIPCTGTCPVGTAVTFTVSNLLNPSTAASPTESIGLTSYTNDRYVIDSVSSGFFAQPGIALGSLINTAIAYSSTLTGAPNSVTFTGTSQNSVSNAGLFVIQPPVNLFFFDAAYPITCSMGTTTLPCTISTLVGTYGNYITTVTVNLTLVCNPCAADTIFNIVVNNLINFFTTLAPTSAIRMTTIESGLSVDTGNINSAQIPALTPNTITMVSGVTRSVTTLNAQAAYTFHFKISTLIPSQGVIRIGIAASNQAYIDSTLVPVGHEATHLPETRA